VPPSLRFSLPLPRYQDPGERDPYRRTYEFARYVEELGYDAGFMGHHSFTPETQDPSAPFVLMAAVAARTERLRLGTGIFLAGLHHPVAICEQVSTLDQISNGRVILGIGAGYRQYEWDGFGLPFNERGRRVSETIEMLKQAWTTGRYGYRGTTFSVPDLVVYPGCVQQPHPPVYVGGTSQAAIKRAARLGDAWFSLPMETLPYVKNLADQYRAECAAAGTKPRICLMRETWVAEDRHGLSEWLGRALSFHKYYWETGTRGDESDPVLQRVGAGEQVPLEEFARDRAFAGTPDAVIAEIQRWHDAIGFDEVCLIFATGRESASEESLRRTVTTFARDVVPAFR
jgi:probable F420-dependent oxidoreductase